MQSLPAIKQQDCLSLIFIRELKGYKLTNLQRKRLNDWRQLQKANNDFYDLYITRKYFHEVYNFHQKSKRKEGPGLEMKNSSSFEKDGMNFKNVKVSSIYAVLHLEAPNYIVSASEKIKGSSFDRTKVIYLFRIGWYTPEWLFMPFMRIHLNYFLIYQIPSGSIGLANPYIGN